MGSVRKLESIIKMITPPTMPYSETDRQLELQLTTHVEALHGFPEAAYRMRQQASEPRTRDLMALAEQLDSVLIPYVPSPEFIERLRGEFITKAPPSLRSRWRTLSPRYQTVAKVGGATITAGLTAGLMVFAARRAWSIYNREPISGTVEQQA